MPGNAPGPSRAGAAGGAATAGPSTHQATSGGRNGIPVPREQQRTVGRRPSLRETAQAPWRSSLDLVWSYSRSQAFYGENIGTSPSFVDRHWAGPSGPAGQSTDESLGEEDDEEEEELYTETDLDGETEDGDDVEPGQGQHGYYYPSANHPGEMEWTEEQLPPNATARRRSSHGLLGSRERRRRPSGSSAINSAQTAAAAAAARDRRISTLAGADESDEERSRSRSRSPKRVGASAAAPDRSAGRGSGLRDSWTDPETSSSGQSSDLPAAGLPRGGAWPRRSYGAVGSANAGMGSIQWKKSFDSVSGGGGGAEGEGAPLLGRRRSRASLGVPGEGARRTSSYCRSSGMSSGARFAAQGYGTSTFWQSWFNTVNALVGVGILALPLALSYAGWVVGILLFVFCGLLTNYTGKLLAHIMSHEPSLRTYADIGNFAFGKRARLGVGLFFCVELWAVATALIILFGDSVYALAQGYGSPETLLVAGMDLKTWPPAAFKALGLFIVLPTIFLPLKLLSPVSVVGIVSVTTLFGVVLADGISKRTSPGSLWQPSHTSVGPQWDRVPLSFGLILSGLSSHPVIPSLFKDMRDPRKFPKMLNLAYVAATIIYLSMGVIGYLMFGNGVSDEITRDLARTPGYPQRLNQLAIWLIIINPLAKFALAVRPINTTLELLVGIEKSFSLSQLRPAGAKAARVSSSKGDDAVERGRPVAAVNSPPVTDPSATPKAARSPILSSEEFPPRQDGPSPLADRILKDSGTNGAAATSEEDTTSRPLGGGGGGALRLSSDSRHPTIEEVDEEEEQDPYAGSVISLRAAKHTARWSEGGRVFARAALRTVVACLIGLTAIALPGFETVMAILGATLAFITCILGPVLANLKLFHSEMSRLRIAADIVVLSLTLVLAVTGTIWAFLPDKTAA